MTVIDTVSSFGSSVMALAVGIALGAICFGGLWWTVTQGMRSNNPALWLLLSALGRLGLVFAGIYFLARDSLTNVLLCLTGLLIARTLIVRYFRTAH
jgi:F1F0 ATPase subunit 2